MAVDALGYDEEHFDQWAITYDIKYAEGLKQISDTLVERKDWIGVNWSNEGEENGHSIKVLDYACGTGVVSKALVPYTTSLVGVDISQGMVAGYNKAARERGLGPERMAAYRGNLISEEVTKFADAEAANFEGPEFWDFDLIVISMALHHFEDPAGSLTRLVKRLRKGGVCFVLDMLPRTAKGSRNNHGQGHGQGEEQEHGHDKGHGQGHGHGEDGGGHDKGHEMMGFSREGIEDVFKQAGVGNKFGYQALEEPLRMEMAGKKVETAIFLARGEKL